MRVVVIAGFVAAMFFAGCSDDCRIRCETERACGAETASLSACTRTCQLRVEDQASSDQLSACASCYQGKSCDELFPTDLAEAGSCDAACGR